MKKMFVISWFYPPINSSEGLVTYKLLNNSKYNYDVFTQKNQKDWTYGDNCEYKNNKNVNTIFAESNTKLEWVDEAVKYFDEHKDEYDTIMTRAMPYESHMVGRKIKKKYPNIKWIASFGDPIDKNPYQYINCSLYSYFSLKNIINKNMTFSQKIRPGRILHSMYWNHQNKGLVKFRKYLEKLQKDSLNKADLIILNNESQKKYMIGENKKLLEKVVVLNHSYDTKMYPAVQKEKNKKIRFAFMGHLDELRTPLQLFEAIKSLKDEKPDLSNDVEFLFYGDMCGRDKLYLLDNDLFDVVKICKPISYQESLEEMQKSDWLIHVDGNIQAAVDENIFFAAKIADYFGSGSQVMAITMQNGDIINKLKKANALVLSYSSEEIKNYLYLIIYKNFKKELDKKYIDEFDAKNVAKKFDETLKSCDII